MNSQMLFPTFEKVREALPFSHRYALIKFGGGVVGMSGSIAGNTFSRNRYGAYVRARTKPVNPRSPAQSLVRAAMAELTTRWAQTLDGPQRELWNEYGAKVNMLNKLSETINLSGFNHYIRSNLEQLVRKGTITDPGPEIFELPAQDDGFTITADKTSQQITIAFTDSFDWCKEDLACMDIYQGSPQNAQRNFFNGPWRFLCRLNGNSGTPVTSTQVWGVTFPIDEGQHLWCYARIHRADGRLSSPFRDDVFVAAGA